MLPKANRMPRPVAADGSSRPFLQRRCCDVQLCSCSRPAESPEIAATVAQPSRQASLRFAWRLLEA